MYRTHSLQTPPSQLVEYLETKLHRRAELRRRAVLALADDDSWLLVCCAVEAFRSPRERATVVTTRRYPQAILFEDWLSATDCSAFINGIQNGEIELGGVRIPRPGKPSWYVERLPLKNSYMTCAGFLAGTRFEERSANIRQDPLLASSEPYYPDLTEAARDWLPFPIYHGANDARNQHVVFLLPEAGAYFADACANDGVLEVSVDGGATKQPGLIVKGAYWEGQSIRHFESDVKEGKATIRVPDDVDRLDYILTDADGVLYDYQREDRFNHSGLERKRPNAADEDLAQQIRAACRAGEGTQIEFKPFVECSQGMGTRNQKTKLRELVTTVVSFANTQGGHIYLGIDDECGLPGINQELQKWSKQDLSEESVNRYCGALTNCIRGKVIGDVYIFVSHASIDGVVIVVVNVSQSPAKPATVMGDNLFYVRAGANNKQLPPDQWESVLGVREGGIASSYNAN